MTVYMYVCIQIYVCIHVVNRYATFTHVCKYVSVAVYGYIWLMPMRQVFKIFMCVCMCFTCDVGQICRQNWDFKMVNPQTKEVMG